MRGRRAGLFVFPLTELLAILKATDFATRLPPSPSARFALLTFGFLMGALFTPLSNSKLAIDILVNRLLTTYSIR